MKKVLFCLLLACSFIAEGQVYNNEWIDYSKVYYKFKLRHSGVYRISQSVLSSVGLGNVPAEQFQLWRDGVQVPIYTSVSTGAMGSSDYIEFWGERINGKPDKALYRKPEYQLNDYHSLISDSASYFLTVNPAGSNARLVTTPNETAGNTLAPEPYFMHTAGYYPANKLNGGLAYYPGTYLYSSSYDQGEGYTSSDIDSGVNNTNNTVPFNNLFVYPNGPNAKLKTSVSGSSMHDRTYSIVVNNETLLNKRLVAFEYSTDSLVFPSSKISSGSVPVRVANFKGRMVVHKHELTYPRLFNFGAAKNFEFILSASTNKRYLEISNFAFGTVAPVLYDLTNGRRYVGDISAKPLVKFVIQPSAEARYILVNEESSSISSITNLRQRFFVNFADASNQGDFLIISNPLLFNGSNGSNPVDEYRAYRSSAAGGGYKAKVFLVEELTDQFAFGINKHPLGLRNFILYARKQFATIPKHVLLLGKGIDYTKQRSNESNANINLLNLVPTFGWPASDVLLVADPGSSVGKVSIGRISAINAQEVKDYLDKVKEFESAQAMSSPDANKFWMKNVVHIVGVSEPSLQTSLESSMSTLKKIISDTLYGGKVTTLTKQTGSNVEQINSEVLQNLFAEGLSMITYFGHSASSTLSFNLDNPESYNNKGKYPLFIAMGCDVGDIFGYNTNRYSIKQTLSESYVLAQGKGTIGFIASTHYGIVRILDTWSQHVYSTISKTDYGKSIGDILNISAARIQSWAPEDFYYRCNMEQMAYHGDPSIKLNTHAKPDYSVNDQSVIVSPAFISISETSFKVKAKFFNFGQAVNKDVAIEVKREYSDQTSQVVYRDTLKVLLLSDSLTLTLPIDPQRDKGSNKLTITIDADNSVDELYESNNSITKEVFIYEDEIRPIYPYNFAIVGEQNIKLYASTADPLSSLNNYKFEIDTTELFNSQVKVQKTISSKGGVLEFQPGISFKDNTVYYWRVAMVPTTGEYHWNVASFIYLNDSEAGYNQSHLFQHLKSTAEKVELDSLTNKWNFIEKDNELFARNGVYPTTDPNGSFYSVYLNGDPILGPGCNFNEIIFNVIDPVHFKPWKNDFSGNTGLYNSLKANCGSGRDYNFNYFLSNSNERKKAMDFIDMIPDGYYVVVRSNSNSNNSSNTYSNAWKADTTLFGTGNSLYHKFLQQGFNNVDSFNRARSWVFVFKKNDQVKFNSKSAFSEGIYDPLMLTVICPTPSNTGSILSPQFGPAKSWKEFIWAGNSIDADNKDYAKASILGITKTGSVDTLFNIDTKQDHLDISNIDAAKYPYLKLNMINVDTVNNSPYQLKYWRLTYEPVPEGAIAPNFYFEMKDTLEAGEHINFKLAFKNVSKKSFDSLKVQIVIIDGNNVRHVLPIAKQRPLNENDTLHVSYSVDSKSFYGNNTLYVIVNPDDDQPEQFNFNNFIYHDFYVNQDLASPIIDVTFDNVHILNGDIVSAKPNIVIKMTDESSKLLLNDSSLMMVKIRYPDNTVRTFKQDNDTLRFIPAVVGINNAATVEFNPYLMEDGDYELMIYGEDRSGNKAGNTEYRISFKVVNKPMISNMLNYPNPFTTSTSFVFTLTGSEVPQNLKIQILTITGKVVKEITIQELGAIRIGRNITEYKWDGTDQYGQKLANGVYLYRVVTNFNGKSLDKYKSDSDNTDKYFNKGYGKMYLMR